MIALHGTLSVRTIHGRNGDFNVGRLITEIGEFSVKDPELDQYDEGRYDGRFGIEQIYPTSYVAGGRMVMEVRARVGLWELEDVDQLQPEDETPIQDPDPIEEVVRPDEKPEPNPAQEPEGVTTPEATSVEPTTKAESTQPPAEASDTHQELEGLFGELWPLGAEVKLDPTVDRGRFRQQRDHLKQLGYKFRPLDQVWALDSAQGANA